MNASQISRRILLEAGIRLEPRMAAYVERQLRDRSAKTAGGIAVMGGEARTGIPVLTRIPLQLLRDDGASARPS